MIRKQLYITDGQDEAVKDQARRLGISEAELTRRALRAFLSERPPWRLDVRNLLEHMRTLSEKHRLPSGYGLDREDLYTERIDRLSTTRSS